MEHAAYHAAIAEGLVVTSSAESGGRVSIAGALGRAGLLVTVAAEDLAVLDALNSLPWPTPTDRALALGPLGLHAVGTAGRDRSRWLLDLLNGILGDFPADAAASHASVAAASVEAGVVPDPWSYLSWFWNHPGDLPVLAQIVADAYELPCGFARGTVSHCSRPGEFRARTGTRATAFVRCDEHAGGPATAVFRALGVDVVWEPIGR